MVTLVGLGTEAGDLTERGRSALLSAGKIILRSGKGSAAATLDALGVRYETLDGAFPRTRSFETWYKKAAAYIWNAGKAEEVVYCCAGAVGEDRCAQYLAARRGVRVVAGISKAERALELARLPGTAFARVSAYELKETENLTLPAVIYDVDDEFVAGDVKLILGDRVGEENKVFFVRGGKAKKVRVYELDRQKGYDETAAVVVPALPLLEKSRFDIYDLQNIIRRLRRPDGCPWDKVQTPESIRMNMVEEAYELVDAIDAGDPGKIREETGDVLLQAVFHAVMQEERGAFDLTDALTELCEKLIHRHTHIFGKDKAADEASALSVWEANKKKEKGQDTFSKAVNDVPACFPACMRAQKVQKRAGKSGFDFPSVSAAAEKIVEELKEWEHVCEEGNERKAREELGDLLFSVVNAGRLAGVDCELALKESVQKFARRFTALESAVIADGRDITALSPAELDGYYRRVKAAETDETGK